jgi:hypothetical protein
MSLRMQAAECSRTRERAVQVPLVLEPAALAKDAEILGIK